MTILDLFTPCRIGRDRTLLPEDCSEVQLIAERTEEFLQNLTWMDVLQLVDLHNAVWLSRGVLICADLGIDLFPFPYRLHIELDEAQPKHIYLAALSDTEPIYKAALSDTEPTRFFDKIVRLVAQECVIFVSIGCLWGRQHLPLSAGSLSRFLETEVREKVDFINVSFSLDQCQALGTFRGSFYFYNCVLEDEGHSLLDKIEKSKGPRELKLKCTDVDFQALYDALSSSESLKKVSLFLKNDGLCPLLQAVGRNVGLEEFSLGSLRGTVVALTSEWDDAFRSVLQHPTLEEVYLYCYFEYSESDDEYDDNDDDAYDSRERQDKVRRSNMFVDALKRNEVLRKLVFFDELYGSIRIEHIMFDETIYENQIEPLLKANDYRARLKALAKTETDGSLRLAVFSRALLRPVINPDASLVWTVLSGFHDELVALLKTRCQEESNEQDCCQTGEDKQEAAD